MPHLNDSEEAQLLRLLGKLVEPVLSDLIERTSRNTNARWSEVIHFALMVTDWEHIEEVLNKSDEVEALMQVNDILRGNDVDDEKEE